MNLKTSMYLTRVSVSAVTQVVLRNPRQREVGLGDTLQASADGHLVYAMAGSHVRVIPLC